MNLESIVKGLIKRGYDAFETSVVKNGVTLKGIGIKTGNSTAPVIYEDAFKNARTVTVAISKILSIYNNAKVDLDITEITNKDNVLKNIRIGLQRKSDEILVKRDCFLEDVEQYLYVLVENKISGLYKLRPDMLDTIGLSEDMLWEYGTNNTNAETVIMKLADIMIPKSNQLEDKDVRLINTAPLYVVSNTSAWFGASAILNVEALTKWGKENGISSVIVLPSSLHECLLVPYEGNKSLDYFSAMVQDVNKNEVSPEIQLSDRAYKLKLF